MLCELRIQNLALIRSLELNFDEPNGGGLVVMTGETGAGKSIMLRAIHLLTGGRGSADWIRSGADNCTVEALFDINPRNTSLLAQLEENGFGNEPTVIIKRIIGANGRSRLYVNNSLATAKQVALITGEMLSVGSQHDHQQLLQPALHIDFLDTYGDLWGERHGFSEMFAHWQKRREALTELLRREQDKEQRRDFLAFQLEEIEQADPKPGEDEELAAEKKRLKSADQLIKISQESYRLLSDEILDAMSTLRRNMEQLVSLDPQAEKMAEELGGYTFLAEDYATELRHYRDNLECNPLRLEQVSERLDSLHGLKRKYGETLEQVLAFADEARAELNRIENMDREVEALTREVAELEKQLCAAAAVLSTHRKEAAADMETAMARELASLAFYQAGFVVQSQEVERTVDTLRASGWDRIEFFFAANPGEPARPLAKVASGGELSRLMLAMKCLLAQRDMVDTVIFDEVDAGIGGEAAEAVARKIRELAGHHQVFCITHLPQIAAHGNLHFQVAKTVEDGRTQSTVVRLSNSHRVTELARMLAGDSATEQTHAWARELLAKGNAIEAAS
ncbi:DNA repair protein RecN [Desulfopila aestuarii]|uniref:DNA repair protein RecN n=1 Tax=Desulfopila aestuarii DSM 18488 TaxID=1121416 RepID=A0A1M7XZ99_9BACT|nr:DNA repair protein RecN [Desulfopila aestuarii]SHO44485.1 DNA replication and repair protein RecN [Desulfopila aestuarii DSM 18488]